MDGIPAIAEDLRDLLHGFIDREVVIGREALLANKRALGRHRDLADVELLEGSGDD